MKQSQSGLPRGGEKSPGPGARNGCHSERSEESHPGGQPDKAGSK